MKIVKIILTPFIIALLFLVELEKALGEKKFSKAYSICYLLSVALMMYFGIAWLFNPTYTYAAILTISMVALIFLEWGRRSLKIRLYPPA